MKHSAVLFSLAVAGMAFVACSGGDEKPKVLGATVTTTPVPSTLPTTTTTLPPTLWEWAAWQTESHALIDLDNDTENRVVFKDRP